MTTTPETEPPQSRRSRRRRIQLGLLVRLASGGAKLVTLIRMSNWAELKVLSVRHQLALPEGPSGRRLS